MYDLLGPQVFPVGEFRAAGRRFAAQACRRNRGVGLSDEPEQSVDGVAARYDAADEAVEENHLDVEGRLQQFEHQPYGRGQLVGAVALRADHAAAPFDLGDLTDDLQGLLRAGNLLGREMPGGPQRQRQLFHGRSIDRNVELVAVMDIHVRGEDGKKQQQQQRIEKAQQQRQHGCGREQVDESDAAHLLRLVENQVLQVVGVVVREPRKVFRALFGMSGVPGEMIRPAAELPHLFRAAQGPQPGVQVLLSRLGGGAVDALEYGVEVEVGRGLGVDGLKKALFRRDVVEITACQVEITRGPFFAGRSGKPQKGCQVCSRFHGRVSVVQASDRNGRPERPVGRGAVGGGAVSHAVPHSVPPLR